jgi:AraC-like DNA-binding protein
MARQSPVIKAAVFDGVIDFVTNEDLDVDVLALLAEVGLDRSVFDDKGAYIPLVEVSRFFERAAVLSKRPCFGLEYARAYPIGGTGALGYLMVHAATFQAAIDNLVRYLPVLTHPMHIEFKEEAGGVGYVEWVFPLEFMAAMPQYVSFALGVVIQRLRLLAGPDWTPLRVELIHRELPCKDLTRAMFGSRVKFEAAHNRMWLDPTSRAIRHGSADQRLYRTAEIAGETELLKVDRSKARGPEGVRAALREHLSGAMASGELGLETVAGELDMEPRQLQYALDQLKTSYSHELNETRRQAAEAMLSATDLSMTDIAGRLGFSELSSFTRASRELWFGMSPSKFRQRVKAEGSAPGRLGAGDSGPDWAEQD